MTNRRRRALLVVALIGGGVLLLATTSSAKTSSPAKAATVPSWCGPKKITLGLTDGFGGNSWRLVTTASARSEAAKCPSVTSLSYADGQGNTQKAISDIQGMVAKGLKGDPAGAHQRVQGRRRDGSLSRHPGRQGWCQLQRIH
jgi:ribose transport system substrate-binding protein